MKKLCTLFALALLAASIAKAQTGLSEVIKSAPGDADKLFSAYAEPIFKGFGIGMNTGWNNTAKTKGLFGVEIRVSATAAFVPSDKNSFDLSKLGLSGNTRPTDPTQTITPNIGGHSANGPSVSVYDNSGNKLQSFNMPGGSSTVFGAPQIQVTVGLPFHTDVTLRGMPSIYFGSTLGNTGMIGFGVKHNIIEDFLGTGAKLVPFDLAVTGAYTHTAYSFPLSVQPYGGAVPDPSAPQATDFTNQHFGGIFNSYMAGLVISKKLLVITPFVSGYYSGSHTYMVLQGNYPLTTGIDKNPPHNPTYTTYANPINIDEKSISGFQADLGFQLNLALFRVYLSYTLADYSAVNFGVGLGL